MEDPELSRRVRLEPTAVSRVALLSVHTCPLDQPGTGDSGGMNVYVRQAARRLADMGVEVDVFTRWAGASERIREMDPGVRVIHLEAGPAEPIPKEALGEHLCEFMYALLRFEAAESEALGVTPRYDVVHSHYWLSGRVGRLVAERWSVPLVQSFHTLGRVKNLTLADGDDPEPPARISSEERIVRTADTVLAPTPIEAAELVRLYGAEPDRVRVVPPGVDTDVFRPFPDDPRAAELRARLGLEGRSVVLFVGRLQPLKAPEVAVRAVAHLAERRPDLDPVLLVVGGPSGRAGTGPEQLAALAETLGAPGRLVAHEPVPHPDLPVFYRAADVVAVPSRTESFGLVALEATACGTPVVASDVGGLRTAVRDGVGGLLVEPADALAFADGLERVLGDRRTAEAMGHAGARYARRFDWRRAAAGLLAVYEERAGAVLPG
jgi:D-inositol-3-phosphate glycosyltransferase